MKAALANDLGEASVEVACSRLTRLAARLSRAPFALLTFGAANHQIVVSAHGLPAHLAGLRTLPSSHCIGTAVMEWQAALVLGDARMHPILRENGAVREWGVVAYCGIPITDEQGQIHGVLSVMDSVPREWDWEIVIALRDLVQLGSATIIPRWHRQAWRMTEAGLRWSSDCHRAIVEAAHHGICTLDTMGRITYANPRLGILLGRPTAELNGSALWDFMEEAEAVSERERFARLRLGVPTTGETVLCGSTEGRRLVAMSAGPLYDHNSTFAGAVYGLSDISEYGKTLERHRTGERRLRALIENAGDMSAIIEDSGVIRYASPAVERCLGYAVGELTGTLAYSRVHPDDLPDARATVARLLNDTIRSVQLECRYQHKNGGWRTLAATMTSMRDDEAVAGIAINARDITMQTQLGAELRQAQRTEVVGRLAAGVAHDFNNLVQVIVVSNAFARDALPADSPALGDLAAVDTAARRASELTKQLLALSRRQVPRATAVDLNEVVKGTGAMLHRTIGEHITVVMQLEPGLARVHGDLGQLQQVLLNFVVNACDAMQEGGTLTIATESVTLEAEDVSNTNDPPSGRYVALRVTDTGVGMAESIREHIFEPFFTTKEPDKGTGLGLATVHSIVSQLGGYVKADSVIGSGSTFSILLPSLVAVVPPVHLAAALPINAPPYSRERLLLVEDEPSVRSTVRRILERAGYTVSEAENGMAALDELERREWRIDLVLTDAIMPTMGARDLIERIRAINPRMRVLVISGHTEEVLGALGSSAADIAVVSKPFTAEALLRKVREVIDGPNGPGPRQ